MKGMSAALKAHLASDVTTLATLWRVTREDGAIFAFTDAARDILYLGTTYIAATGYTVSAARTSAALNVDSLDVTAILDGSMITDADLLAGLWDHAAIEVMRVNYMSLSDGHEWIRAGRLGEVKTGAASYSAEMRSITQALQQNIGRIFTASCDADLGDTRCGVNIASFTFTGAVTATISAHEFADSSRIDADGYYDGGLLTWTSGGNNTYQMEIKTFASSTFVLQQAMPNDIQIGDAYSVYAGCDKLRETCVNKFANIIRFRGFADVPGTDRMLSGA